MCVCLCVCVGIIGGYGYPENAQGYLKALCSGITLGELILSYLDPRFNQGKPYKSALTHISLSPLENLMTA